MDAPRLVCDRDIAAFDIWAEMWDEPQPIFSANMVREFLDANTEATEVILEVRSDGGSTSEARIIYDMLRNSGKKIITEGYKCNSSAMILFLAGDERLITENSDNIIHPVWVDAYSLPWALEAEDLRLFADDIDAEQTKLLDIYVDIIGESNRAEVEQMMKDTTNLTSDEALRLGFATGKLEGVAAENSTRAAVLTNGITEFILNKRQVKNQNNISDMNKIEKMIQNLTDTVRGLVNNETPEPTPTPETQNASVALDGEDAGSLYYDGELAEGTAVFSDEAMETAASDGDHLLGDGRTVTVAEGVVSAIADAEAENLENSVDLDAVNARIEGLENNLETLVESVNTLAKGVEAQNKSIEDIKNAVPGETKNLTKEKKKQTVVDYKDMTNKQKMEHNRANR